MRFSTLVVASAFAWVLAAGTAMAESPDDMLAADSIAADEVPVLEEADRQAVTADAETIASAEPVAPDAAAEPVPAEPLAEVAPVDPAVEAEETPVALEAPAAPEAAWDDFEDPEFDPNAPAAPEPVVVSQSASSGGPSNLGPMGVDENGVVGRIHTVASGDTLWDISESYLGTPWVWPSIWDENEAIGNPHVIEPGDRIWITSNEMRRVTDAEADELIGAVPDEEIAADIEFTTDEPLLAEEPVPASVEDESPLPAAPPLDPMVAVTGEVLTLPYEASAHYATAATMETASKLVDSPTLRVFLTQGDEVYLDLGDGEVFVGDEFTIFRDVEKIRDVETKAVLGYHYDELGWLKIVEVEGESSTGVISGAIGEMARSDRILPRELPPREIPVRAALEDIEGAIVFTPGYRWMIGTTDAVYLNVGSIHGVELGTKMEVYKAGVVQSGAQMPDTVYAQLVVISLEAETSVAFVTQTTRELGIGDSVRGVMPVDQFAVR